ncbi:MAG: hypothetical protein ACO1TE_05930 [Prosthecobacter sp.]
MGLLDFFRRRRDQAPTVPAYATALEGRYAGRPLLILLENYVLSTIGCLAAEKEQLNASITKRIFGGGDDWRATLRGTLRLEASIDDDLRQMWGAYQQNARTAGRTPVPEDFARRVADENFAHLIEPVME